MLSFLFRICGTIQGGLFEFSRRKWIYRNLFPWVRLKFSAEMKKGRNFGAKFQTFSNEKIGAKIQNHKICNFGAKIRIHWGSKRSNNFRTFFWPHFLYSWQSQVQVELRNNATKFPWILVISYTLVRAFFSLLHFLSLGKPVLCTKVGNKSKSWTGFVMTNLSESLMSFSLSPKEEPPNSWRSFGPGLLLLPGICISQGTRVAVL